jgi:serine protease AprX
MTSRYSTAPALRRLRGLVFLVSLLFAGSASAQGGAVLGPSLQDALAEVGPLTPVEVVVTFDQAGPLSLVQRTALSALGGGGVFFESLPMAGVVALPAQVGQIAQLPGVASVWLNEELTYFNEGSRQITGVDRLRTDPSFRTGNGLPYSGRGVTVVVNDSGIDATHADLPMGSKVVANVQGATNLNAVSSLLPITYLEGTPNTDTNSGHGTHCAATVAGLGVRSAGQHAGVAPGADLVGYGSGAVIAILDGLGGFDYAITHQFSFQNPIRVITNSWGSDGEFAPESPIVQASYRAYQRGIVTLFAASNSGPGEDTHNIYAQAPWVLSIGAGDKIGGLASFSSRGKKGEGYDFQTFDGKTWTYKNDITVVGPGVDIISARAATNLGANGGDGDLDAIPPAQLPFYTMISGTSMSTPHVAGIVALMLEADPTLGPLDVKRILMETATNMPGREAWEVGGGYVNAYAAVAAVLGRDVSSAGFVNNLRAFNANALTVPGSAFTVDLDFSPVGDREVHEFEVGSDVSLVKARAIVPSNTIAVVLESPTGKRYGSGITLPLLGEIAGTSGPGEPGTWKVYISGIGSVSGVALDPLGITNGTALPGTITVDVETVRTSGYSGLGDIAGHPAQAFIQNGVSRRVVDGRANGTFGPDAPLLRQELAQFLVMGAGVRQAIGSPVFTDAVATGFAPYARAVAASGAALKDREGFAPGLVRLQNGQFNGTGTVNRAELAYSLVGALGLHGVASGYTGDVFATFDGERIKLSDSNAIPSALRGYVQLALDAGLLNARFALAQGPFDLEPTVSASFSPGETVTRGAYAVAAVRLLDVYGPADPAATSVNGGGQQSMAPPTLASAQEASLALDGAAPNPTAGRARIAFSLAEAGPARLAVYDLLGREVAVLADGPLEAGAHEVRLDASGLATGAYLYRLTAGDQSLVRQLTVAR